MSEPTNKLVLSELIDLDFLQKFQDMFSDITGIASLTIDKNGAVTKPSNFTEFCSECIRKNEKGMQRCNLCDKSWGEMAADKGKPVIYTCHAGLVDFAVPIMIEGVHLASIYGGQILAKEADKAYFKQLAEEINLDEEKCFNALEKIRVLPQEKIELAANFLFLVANAISGIAHNNYLVNKKIKREKLLTDIIAKISSTFDIDEILTFICSESAKLFNVQRVSVAVFPDKEDLKTFTIRKEYLDTEKIQAYTNTEEAKVVASFWRQNLVKEPSGVLAFENLDENDVPDWFKNVYLKLGIKAVMGTAIRKGGDLWGTLVLSEYNSSRVWTDDDKSLLVSLASQVYIALTQGELYNEIHKTAQREKLLRSIIETLRSSLDLNEVKARVTKVLGKVFNADRCFFRLYNKKQEKFSAPEFEYLSSKDLLGLTTQEPNQEELKYFLEEVKKQKKGFWPIVVNEKTVRGTPLEEYFKKFNIKADYAIPIITRTDELQWLALHYTQKDPELAIEDLEILETIAYQIDIAFEQIELYNKTQKIAKKEQLLRTIVEKIRSSLDLDETLSFICEEITKVFNVQRTSLTKVVQKNGKLDFEVRKEYKISDDIKSYKDAQDLKDIQCVWDKNIRSDGRVWAVDNLNEVSEAHFCEFYSSIGVKSIIGIAIRKDDDILGALVLSEYNNSRHWTEDEIELLEMISDQIYIAINQAELYERQKVMLERERMSRTVIEILRSSIDKKIIKKLFVKSIGKFFNADRVLLSEYDSNKKIYLPVDEDSEYLSGSDVKSFINYDWTGPESREYMEPLLNRRELNIFNWDEYIKNNPKSQDFINLFVNAGVKSSYNFPVLYQQKTMGYFCIEFTQKVVELTEEEIHRIRSLCTQAGIALYNAELYAIAQNCEFSRKSLFFKMADKIEPSVKGILENATILSEKEFERSIQIEYLRHIIDSCNELIELTHNASEN